MQHLPISKNQAFLLAVTVKQDIAQYISEHREEYEAFLLTESNNSASTPNHD